MQGSSKKDELETGTMAESGQVQQANSPVNDATLFAGLRMFRGVDEYLVASCLARTARRDVAEGETLLSPEIPNKFVFLILSGQMRVHLESAESEAFLTLEAGDCAGEMSIIEEKDPSAWVIAESECHLMVLDRKMLWELIDTSHAFSRNILRVLSARLRNDNQAIAGSSDMIREYQRNAVTDALTELHNRHWMEDMFRRRLARMQDDGIQATFMMLDVDYFKNFNDQYGHLAGDHALCHVASTLREHFRPSDMIARYGGDEFAVLLPETDMEEAFSIAERVRKAVHESLDTDAGNTGEAPITISVGIADMKAGHTLESLLNDADSALYRAKLQGRDRVCS